MEIYVGRRLVRRLSGGGRDDDDDDDDKHHYDDDDECDDDDDDDFDDLDDIDEEEDGRPRVVTIQGTGEIVRIVFRSDFSVTRRGFFARYTTVASAPPGEIGACHSLLRRRCLGSSYVHLFLTNVCCKPKAERLRRRVTRNK